MAGIIDLAHALGARAVAEGVESEAAARHLTELGCDVLQGFHLGQPMSPDRLVDWVRDPRSDSVGREDRSRQAGASPVNL